MKLAQNHSLTHNKRVANFSHDQNDSLTQESWMQFGTPATENMTL